MPDVSQWKRLVDERKQRTEHVASELRAHGMAATGHVSAAVDELMARSRRRSEELRDVVAGELRRPVDALGTAAHKVAAAREFAAEYVAAAVRLDVFGARRDALHDEVRVEVERQLNERAVATTGDLRQLERRLKGATPKGTRAASDEAPTPKSAAPAGGGKANTSRTTPAERPTVTTRPL